MEIIPLGDSALIVRVRDQCEDAPEETLDEVLRTLQQLRNAAIPGVIEVAPAYTTVALFFDPVAVAKARETPGDVFDWLAEKIRSAIASGSAFHRRRSAAAPRLIEIPVCYDAEFGLDLDRVGEHTKLSAGEVVDLHSTAEYRVACIGFVPGFPFLIGLPKTLATPRRATPRKEIPPGSVGIGGAQSRAKCLKHQSKEDDYKAGGISHLGAGSWPYRLSPVRRLIRRRARFICIACGESACRQR